MSAASQTVQQVPANAGTNCSSDSSTPEQGEKLIPINICRQTVTATVTVQQRFSSIVQTVRVQSSYDKGPHVLLWAGSWDERGKI